MDEILSATVDSRNGIVLDPRTKLFMLITITTLMFSTSNVGIMNIVKPILSLIPFALINSLTDVEEIRYAPVLIPGAKLVIIDVAANTRKEIIPLQTFNASRSSTKHTA